VPALRKDTNCAIAHPAKTF